jgi:hypothetical protein
MQTKEVRSTLIQSGPTTRAWLSALRDQLKEFNYHESKYWAAYRRNITCRSFAQLNPRQKSVRLFVRLKANEDPELKDTPATRSWAEYFPSFFRIKSEQDLSKAKLLILKSHETDRSLR